MILKYKINNNQHYITFCKKNNINVISRSLENFKSDKNVLFVYDNNVDNNLVKEIFDELKLSGCNIISLKCEGNKVNKNEKLLFKIIDILIKNKFTKKSIVISFGGGVVGDVSALASCLYLRGLIYFCIPSTMTSIVDSCVGGKTAINYNKITNSIGTYFHPKNVFVLENVISKLPDREFNAGFAEIIKCGIVNDKKIIFFLIKNRNKILNRETKSIFKICYLTLNTKIKLFKDDIFEKNERLKLNFGHTFAHAIEMAIENNLKKDFIRHGEAVGLGLLCEIFYANKSKNELFKKVFNLLSEFNLPNKIDFKKCRINQTKLQNMIYQNIFLDKKRIDKYPRYISVKKIGVSKIKEMKNLDLINDTILKVLF